MTLISLVKLTWRLARLCLIFYFNSVCIQYGRGSCTCTIFVISGVRWAWMGCWWCLSAAGDIYLWCTRSGSPGTWAPPPWPWRPPTTAHESAPHVYWHARSSPWGTLGSRSPAGPWGALSTSLHTTVTPISSDWDTSSMTLDTVSFKFNWNVRSCIERCIKKRTDHVTFTPNVLLYIFCVCLVGSQCHLDKLYVSCSFKVGLFEHDYRCDCGNRLRAQFTLVGFYWSRKTHTHTKKQQPVLWRVTASWFFPHQLS